MIRFLAAILVLLPALAHADPVVRSPITIGPGLSVEGSRISPYSPQVCDGYSGTDGSMPSGGAALTSATAHFASGSTPAVIGQPFTVTGAASTQTAKSVAVATGGLGYTAMDAPTLSDGTTLEVLVAGNIEHAAAAAATTVALTTTYSNSAATLTNAGALAALTVDGVAINNGDRVLVKNQANAFENGIYTQTTLGTGAVAWVLTRAGDFNSVAVASPTQKIFAGAWINITGGSQATTNWTMTTVSAITVGVTDLVWAEGTGGVVSLARVKTGLSTASPPSNPATATGGTGAGLTVTMTYLRDNLVTTVASITSDTVVQLTAANASGGVLSGAIYGGGSDYSTEIQAALATANGARLPPGQKCGINQQITLAANNIFLGQGSGQVARQSTLQWLGANNATPVLLDTGSAATGILLGNFNFDGLGASATSMYLKGIAAPGCNVYPISVYRVRSVAGYIDSYVAESQYCNFSKLEAYLTAGNASAADGWYFGPTGNVNHHRVFAYNSQTSNGRGLICGAVDSTSFYSDAEQQIGGTGVGLAMLGRAGDLRSACNSNFFAWQEAIGGTYCFGAESGFPVANCRNNTLIDNRVSGAPVPRLDPSTTLNCHTNLGADVCGTPSATAFNLFPTRSLVDYTFLPGDAGLMWDNQLATGEVDFTLPEAAGSGRVYCVRRTAAHMVKLKTSPGSADTITLAAGVATTAGTGYLSTTTQTSSLCVMDRAAGAGGWQIQRPNGNWCIDTGTCVQFGLSNMAQDSTGVHFLPQGSAPALTSCGGGSPAILGTDTAGTVTMGTTATGCVITFATAYQSAPYCVVSWVATPLASQSYTTSTNAITLTQTSTSGNVVKYICLGQPGG